MMGNNARKKAEAEEFNRYRELEKQRRIERAKQPITNRRRTKVSKLKAWQAIAVVMGIKNDK